jgi:hypothetical protein
MSTLRPADEVRPAKLGAKAAGEADPDMVAIAETIIECRSSAFEPVSFRDRYQDALRELVEAKTKETGDNVSSDRRAAQGHQSDGSLEAQRCAGRRARSEAPTSRPTQVAHLVREAALTRGVRRSRGSCPAPGHRPPAAVRQLHAGACRGRTPGSSPCSSCWPALARC